MEETRHMYLQTEKLVTREVHLCVVKPGLRGHKFLIE